MKIEFDPISRALRFIKFFIFGLIVSVAAEYFVSKFMQSHFKIAIMNFWEWSRYGVLHAISFFHHTDAHVMQHFWRSYWHLFFTWHGAVPAAAIIVSSIALGIVADWFFLWYQRTHMQNKN